jgi:hypothetical protein
MSAEHCIIFAQLKGRFFLVKKQQSAAIVKAGLEVTNFSEVDLKM